MQLGEKKLVVQRASVGAKSNMNNVSWFSKVVPVLQGPPRVFGDRQHGLKMWRQTFFKALTSDRITAI